MDLSDLTTAASVSDACKPKPVDHPMTMGVIKLEIPDTVEDHPLMGLVYPSEVTESKLASNPDDVNMSQGVYYIYSSATSAYPSTDCLVTASPFIRLNVQNQPGLFSNSPMRPYSDLLPQTTSPLCSIPQARTAFARQIGISPRVGRVGRSWSHYRSQIIW
jgi:hypothetical protein